MKWVHDGQELQRTARIEEVFVEEQGLAKLTIREFSPTDVGEYKCVVTGEVIEPDTDMLRRERTISSTTVVEMAEVIPEVTEEAPTEVVQEEPVLEQPTVEEPPKIAELKFTKPLQPALSPNEERVLE